VTDTLVFSRLLDRDNYLPGLWDLHEDLGARDYWIDTLSRNLQHMVGSYAQEASTKAKRSCEAAQAEYLQYLDDFKSSSKPERPRTVNALVEVRQNIFESFGVPDPYKSLKVMENNAALAMLSQVRLPVFSNVSLFERLRWDFSMIMAGNFFDMGSAAAREEHTGISNALLERAVQLTAKDWFRDDLKRLASILERGPQHGGSVLVCIDNAGAEIVLGVPSLIKTLAAAGFRTTIVANESPALNDMTAAETTGLLGQIGMLDTDVKSLMESETLHVVSSGSRTSGLDMTRVSSEFDDAASVAELLVIIGQGRAVETNWHTKLALPWARAAVVKDRLVAQAVGCELFDPLLTFEVPG
jgi:type II pantothenate kinase